MIRGRRNENEKQRIGFAGNPIFTLDVVICGPEKSGTQQEESFMFGRVIGAVEDVGGGYTKEGLTKLSAINRDIEKRDYSTHTRWLAHHWYGKALFDSGYFKNAVNMLQIAESEASLLGRDEQEKTAELLGQAQARLTQK